MRGALVIVALFGLSSVCGCDELVDGPHQQVIGCSAGFETCNGADDCLAACLCGSEGEAACERRCGDRPGPRIAELDQSAWPSEAASFEQEVLRLTNEARAQGACCGDEGCFPASAALELDQALRSAARSHAADMAARDYFDHDSPEGLSPFDRMREGGYRGCAMGENIAAGQPDPAAVMESWLQSPGHCANIMQPDFTLLGVGYVEGDVGGARFAPIWVQNFGG
jgi:uncharacterized protein YkwD